MASLDPYRAKRDPALTPEPIPPPRRGSRKQAEVNSGAPRFVVQEHHARALHWDFRLERDDVLVSWAVPKGLPPAPGVNHLAVHTEDHPLEYLSFAGDIPSGAYGAGTMSIWDHGTYECDKWDESDVKVNLHGQRASGRYGLFRTNDDNWMIHRIDPVEGGFEPIPRQIAPMLAVKGPLPASDDGLVYEFRWDGARTILYSDGGRIRLESGSDSDLTAGFPELRAVGAAVGPYQAVLDGEIIALDKDGRPSVDALAPRLRSAHAGKARTRIAGPPISYMIFDLLHFDGHSTLQLPYSERRAMLERLALDGPSFATPPGLTERGSTVLEAARSTGLDGIVAKRAESPYLPGERSAAWTEVTAGPAKPKRAAGGGRR